MGIMLTNKSKFDDFVAKFEQKIKKFKDMSTSGPDRTASDLSNAKKNILRALLSKIKDNLAYDSEGNLIRGKADVSGYFEEVRIQINQNFSKYKLSEYTVEGLVKMRRRAISDNIFILWFDGFVKFFTELFGVKTDTQKLIEQYSPAFFKNNAIQTLKQGIPTPEQPEEASQGPATIQK